MERSEHPIVSECLKSSENVTGVGGETRQFASSSLHPDSTSSSFHMSSGNDGILHYKELYAYSHPYINFTGKNSDKDWREDVTGQHEKERSILGAYTGPGFSDPLASTLRGGIWKDKLRHSKSLISAKSVEIPPKRVLSESISGENSSQNNGNGLLAACSIINKIHDSEFEKDFSLTGAEDNQGVPDTGRVLSSGSSTIVESFLTDNSSVVRGDGRTSAVAEVPMLIRSNSIAPSSAQNDAVSSVPAEPSDMNRLNMAEILAQVPLRVHTTPMLSVENQRFEELAIKQSRQLIPMTPSMPKTLLEQIQVQMRMALVPQESKVGPQLNNVAKEI